MYCHGSLPTESKSKLLYDWRSVSMYWCRDHFETCDQILLPVWRLLPESCGPVSVWCSLWREDGSAVCSSITQWSEIRSEPVTVLHYLIWDPPNLEGQVPVFISPRNKVAQLYPWALCPTESCSYKLQKWMLRMWSQRIKEWRSELTSGRGSNQNFFASVPVLTYHIVTFILLYQFMA
jgi:hypothetical protein